MYVGEVQAGVGVAADDHCFSPAAHGAAQGVAMGFGGIAFHAFAKKMRLKARPMPSAKR